VASSGRWSGGGSEWEHHRPLLHEPLELQLAGKLGRLADAGVPLHRCSDAVLLQQGQCHPQVLVADHSAAQLVLWRVFESIGHQIHYCLMQLLELFVKVRHDAGVQDSTTTIMAPLDLLSEARWLDFWDHYQGLPHQREAVLQLRKGILGAQPGLLEADAGWAKAFTPEGAQVPPRPIQLPTAKPLRRVIYQPQTDSQIPGMADRMCFSSTMTMFANFYRPGILTGKNADDQYLRLLMAAGKSTQDADAHVQQLRKLGIGARYTQAATWQLLLDETAQGRVVAVGWYHNGPASRPKRDHGHWSLVASADTTRAIHYDPYGEADLVNGGYLPSKNGAALSYSRKNWGPRWLADGPASGWAIVLKA